MTLSVRGRAILAVLAETEKLKRFYVEAAMDVQHLDRLGTVPQDVI